MAATSPSTAVVTTTDTHTTYSYPANKPYVAPVPMQRTSNVREVKRGDGTMEPLLFDLISIASPHRSEGELRVRDLIVKFLKSQKTVHHIDRMGNLIAQVGRVGDRPEYSHTMFSCHMDTVHSAYADVTPMVTIGNTSDAGWIYGAKKNSATTFHNSLTDTQVNADKLPELFKALGIDDLKPSLTKVGTTKDGKDVFRIMRDSTLIGAEKTRIVDNAPVLTKTVHGPVFTEKVLGADDKVGCYILCKLIEAGVPGLYVFHVGEESGGVGSKWIARNTPDLVKGIHRCIAFDRQGYKDVIIEQGGGDTASHEFGDALAEALNQFMPPLNQYASSTHGVYTDSAEYVELIPECTNLSVGYVGQHTSNERFDLHFLQDILIPAVTKVNWEALPVAREKGPRTSRWSQYTYRGGNSTYTGGSKGRYFNSSEDDSDLDPNVGFEEYYNRKFGDNSYKTEKSKSVESFPDASEGRDAEDRRIIAALDKVPYAMVTKATPMDKIPAWEPEDGLLAGVSGESMKMIIAAWIINTHKTARELAAEYYDMMVDLDIAAEQLDTVDRNEFFDR